MGSSFPKMGSTDDVQFQRVPRSVLDRLLPSRGRENVTVTQQRPISNGSVPALQPKVVFSEAVASKVTSRNLSPSSSPIQSTVIKRLKSIISEEAGITIEQLDVDASFTELGIDSLLSITISSRAEDEIGLAMQPSSFSDFPTMNDMIKHFAPSEQISASTSIHSTPRSEEDDVGLRDATDGSSIDGELEILDMVRAMVAEEVGISPAELTPATNLLDLGVDSLMSLTITDKLEQLDIKLPPNFLADCHTMDEIDKVISQMAKIVHTLPLAQREISHDPLTSIAFDAASAPHATSVRLQGPSKELRNILWLFPDGAGSATSYSTLPPLSSSWAVHGLNCPWLKTPHDLRCTLPQYVSKMVLEIKRKQPVGPYKFGGWSAGGILAYEAAQQLTKQGHQIAKLILLDSPNPIGIKSPPKAMYDFLESLDLFATNGREPPSWLRPHFTAFIAMLDKHCPVPFSPKESAPITCMVYARDGLCKNPGDRRPDVSDDGTEDTREMTWLLNNRTNFSGDGWKDLVGNGHLRVSVVDEANHYTMLRAGAMPRRLES